MGTADPLWFPRVGYHVTPVLDWLVMLYRKYLICLFSMSHGVVITETEALEGDQSFDTTFIFTPTPTHF